MKCEITVFPEIPSLPWNLILINQEKWYFPQAKQTLWFSLNHFSFSIYALWHPFFTPTYTLLSLLTRQEKHRDDLRGFQPLSYEFARHLSAHLPLLTQPRLPVDSHIWRIMKMMVRKIVNAFVQQKANEALFADNHGQNK